ncbi:hypothetical protein K435DRAFT_808543 [Dendrothele bispora CBS 962.96]|uniref:Hydrophobin n=1 Tax=Dendrothele bispora (strain CBS 962.96) TaxID=1314807 RepID=A0A4S8L172_DENBC|nr:hypothetical protein K435DRAFT_808543 [Dendrothele bispora CBS 962.96]
MQVHAHTKNFPMIGNMQLKFFQALIVVAVAGLTMAADPPTVNCDNGPLDCIGDGFEGTPTCCRSPITGNICIPRANCANVDPESGVYPVLIQNLSRADARVPLTPNLPAWF